MHLFPGDEGMPALSSIFERSRTRRHRGCLARKANQAARCSEARLKVKVYARVKAVVIPFRFVVAAPVPIAFHAIHVAMHCATVLSKAASIVVDSGAICLQPAMAVGTPVVICHGGSSGKE